jgi:predicted enzyme related to lactoylglutathione lyase
MDRAAPAPVVHLELHTGALTEARVFYAQLCGWTAARVETPAGAYLALGMGRRVGGGIVQCPVERPLWLPYVEVAAVTEATEHAQRLGAHVLLAPREGPQGWRSVVSSPAAGEVALWQPKG